MLENQFAREKEKIVAIAAIVGIRVFFRHKMGCSVANFHTIKFFPSSDLFLCHITSTKYAQIEKKRPLKKKVWSVHACLKVGDSLCLVLLQADFWQFLFGSEERLQSPVEIIVAASTQRPDAVMHMFSQSKKTAAKQATKHSKESIILGPLSVSNLLFQFWFATFFPTTIRKKLVLKLISSIFFRLKLMWTTHCFEHKDENRMVYGGRKCMFICAANTRMHSVMHSTIVSFFLVRLSISYEQVSPSSSKSTRSPATYCFSNDVSVWVAPAFIKSNGKKRTKTKQYCQHPPPSPVSIGKPVPKTHQWTIYFCRWGFGWVDKAQCFRSARRFGAVGSSPDFSRFFHDFWLLGI